MKKIALFAIAAASLGALATPAAAQSLVTGTVDITGTVSSKCLVVPANSSNFGATVNLGELAKADGTLETSAVLEGRFVATTGSLSAKVICTTADPQISIDATQLTTAGAAPTGYANRVDFTANVAVDKAAGGTATFSNDSAAADGAFQAVGGALANSPNNVRISATGFNTAPGALLVAGGYTGQIVVKIKPTA